MFSEHTYSFSMGDSSAVSCMEYDSLYDMLWLGNADGRISSFSIGGFLPLHMFSNEMDGAMNLFKYSSFSTHEKCLRVVPNQSAIITVAPTNIRSFSYGGAPYGSIKLQDCLPYVEKPETNIDDATFTCANLLKNPDMLNPSGHLLSGTSSGHVLLQDLQTMVAEPYMVSYYNIRYILDTCTTYLQLLLTSAGST